MKFIPYLKNLLVDLCLNNPQRIVEPSRPTNSLILCNVGCFSGNKHNAILIQPKLSYVIFFKGSNCMARAGALDRGDLSLCRASKYFFHYFAMVDWVGGILGIAPPLHLDCIRLDFYLLCRRPQSTKIV